MSDAGVRIERISPINLDQVTKSHSPLKKRVREEEQAAPISRKRVREDDKVAPPTAKRPRTDKEEPSVLGKRKREDDELFPQLKRSRELPEKGAENVDFNRNVWTSAKPVQEIEQQTLIGTHRTKNKPMTFEPVEKDPLSHLPKVGGYYVAQIIGQAYEVHMLVQQNQLEVFKVTQSSVERLRDDKLELMKQQIANGELQANWSYRGELLQYIGISANFFGGLGLTMTGNPVAFSAGTKMMAGSALTLGAKLTQNYTDQKVLASAMALGGMALSGYGMKGGLSALTQNDLAGKLATGTKAVYDFSAIHLQNKQRQAQAGQMGLQSQNITNQFKRETAKQDMDKIIGGFAKKEHINTVAAAAKLISTEDQIKSDIARGKS